MIVTHTTYIIKLEMKRKKIEKLFARFFNKTKTIIIVKHCLQTIGLKKKQQLSIIDLTKLYKEVGKKLINSVGTHVAYKAIKKANLFTNHERKKLSETYGTFQTKLNNYPKHNKVKKHQTYDISTNNHIINKHNIKPNKKTLQFQKQKNIQMKIKQTLHESEKRYWTTINSSINGIAIIKDGYFIHINQPFAIIFGYLNQQELIGAPIETIILPQKKLKILELSLQKQNKVKTFNNYNFKSSRKNGSPILISLSAVANLYHGKTVILTYVHDITAYHQAKQNIHRLSHLFTNGIENERKQLAANLHDKFGQTLTSLHFKVEALTNTLKTEQKWQRQTCLELIHSIENLADNIRLLSSNLRLDMLDHLGLIPVINWYISKYQKEYPEIKIKFIVIGFSLKKQLNHKIEIILYRILQEALNNTAKYSQAKHILIQLINSYPQVILHFRDDGIGFTPSINQKTLSTNSFGHINMRERVNSVGGTIKIYSVSGKGVSIRAELPLIKK